MFPVKLLPLFVIGCATGPDTQGEVETEPKNDPTTDPTTDPTDPTDNSSDGLTNNQFLDPTNEPKNAPIDEPRNDPPNDPFEPADFESMDSHEVRNAVREDLFSLMSLEIVSVYDVLLDVPAEAICGYGWSVCPGFEDDVDDALREVGPRLETLVHRAELAVNEDVTAQDDTCSDAVIDVNLDALADLEIVLIGDLLVEEPERNCPYGLPCDEDIIAAAEITCERADTLDRIVQDTRKL